MLCTLGNSGQRYCGKSAGRGTRGSRLALCRVRTEITSWGPLRNSMAGEGIPTLQMKKQAQDC